MFLIPIQIKKQAWAEGHKDISLINYSGSAPGMEAVGACQMWQRSEERTKFGILPFLAMAIASLFLQFHRQCLILWLNLIVYGTYKSG